MKELLRRLRRSARWVGAQFAWVLAWLWVNIAISVLHPPEWLSGTLGVGESILITIAAVFVQAGMLRNLMSGDGKRVHLVWGSIALLIWGTLYLIVAELQDYLHSQTLQWLLAWVVAPIIFFPFAAASAVWAWRLPWRESLRAACAWRWWMGALLAGMTGKFAELYFDDLRGWPRVWDVGLEAGLKMWAVDMFELVVWILLLGWLAVVFDKNGRYVESAGSSAPLPLAESGHP